MILIIGSNHDDILYFDTIISNRRKEKILDIFDATFGTILNQEVVVLSDVFSNYLSSSLVSYIIQRYFVVLTIVVGRCITVNNDNKVGDIIISREIILGDVDQVSERQVKLGQIPGLPLRLRVDDNVVNYLSKAFEEKTDSDAKVETYISTNQSYTLESEMDLFRFGDRLMSSERNFVIDNILGGAAVSCYLTKVPCVGVKVVERVLGKKNLIDNYLKVVQKFSAVGKAIVNVINDIGRRDVIGGENENK